MKRYFILALLCIFVLPILLAHIVTSTVQAAGFSSAYVRPERTKTSVNSGPILITASVSDAVVEDEFRIVFGSAWSNSSSSSDYTVSTANLPSGVTAWPSIGTASAVSGSTVHFPSGDLTSGITYGFYLTGGIPLNPATAGSSHQYIWQLQSVASSSIISQTDVVVPVTTNDQVIITAQVSPPLTDFSATINTTDETTEIPQDTVIDYVITYGSTYSNSTPVTLVADWSDGTLDGGVNPTIELLEYVAGSASNAYNSTPPVIDLNAQTITWTISSLPANTTNQTVTFSLRTTDTYAGSLSVSGQVGAQITQPVTTVKSTHDLSYLYDAPIVTDDDTPTSTTTTTTTTTSTPTPTPLVSELLSFLSYKLLTVDDSSALVEVSLSKPAQVYLVYGTQLNSQTQKIQAVSVSKTHRILLENLLPNTQYFVTIVAYDTNGEIKSEQLQITTTISIEEIGTPKISFLNKGAHIFTSTNPDENSILVPNNDSFEIILELENDKNIKSAIIYLEKIDIETNENKSLLGKMIYATQLSRTQQGLWSGKIDTALDTGMYRIIVVVETIHGSKHSFPIGTIHISTPITITDNRTNLPIERARIFIKKFNEKTRLFELLTAPEYLPFNPMLTNTAGQIMVILPLGYYELEILALGYNSNTYKFDTQNKDGFPKIVLQKESFPYTDRFIYHMQTLQLKLQRAQEIIRKEANSHASIRLATLLTLFITTPLTLFGLAAQSHFSFRTFISTLKHHKNIVNNRNEFGNYLFHGSIIDGTTHKRISSSLITLLGKDNTIQSTIHTTKNGTFTIQHSKQNQAQKVLITATGYVPTTVELLTDPLSNQEMVIALNSSQNRLKLIQIVKKISMHVLVTTLEFNLIASVLLSTISSVVYQNTYALFFLGVSVLNGGIYALTRLSEYTRQLYSSK